MDKQHIFRKFKIRKLRPTAVREMVMEYLLERDTAVSLKELEEVFYWADRSTLYRTLKAFEEKKAIHSIDDGSGVIKYAVCADNCTCEPHHLHAHFHCIKCKLTYCLNEIPVPEVQLPPGYKVTYINYVVKGICPKCGGGE